MEDTSRIVKDVAEPDPVASGVAETGQEKNSGTGIYGERPVRKRPWNRTVIGLGMLYNGSGYAGALSGSPAADLPSGCEESPADLSFTLADRQDRIADRLTVKIARLDRRLRKIEERGWD
jgi:hypothetical protein